MAGVAIKGVNSYTNHKRNEAINLAMEQLYANDANLHNQIKTLQNRTSMMAATTFKGLTTIKNAIKTTQSAFKEMKAQFQFLYMSVNRAFRQTHTVLNNHHLSLKFIKRFLYHVQSGSTEV